MRALKLVFVCVCLATLNHSLWAQAANRAHKQPSLGYVDPYTGEFRQAVPQVDASSLATVTPTTGTFQFVVTITLKSTIPSTDILVCSASTVVVDAGTGADIEELASVAATRTTGGGTCTVNIPYSWILSTPTQDRVSLQVAVSTAPGSSTGSPLPSRESIHGLGSIAVPATSTTPTKETVAITM